MKQSRRFVNFPEAFLMGPNAMVQDRHGHMLLHESTCWPAMSDEKAWQNYSAAQLLRLSLRSKPETSPWM